MAILTSDWRNRNAMDPSLHVNATVLISRLYYFVIALLDLCSVNITRKECEKLCFFKVRIILGLLTNLADMWKVQINSTDEAVQRRGSVVLNSLNARVCVRRFRYVTPEATA